MSAAIAQDIWNVIDKFHDNATLSVIARLSKACNKRTKALLIKRKQEKKTKDTQAYRYVVFMSLKMGAFLTLPPHISKMNARVVRAGNEYKCFMFAVGEAGGEHFNSTVIPTPDASDEYEDALQRACDLHAVSLYETFGPL